MRIPEHIFLKLQNKVRLEICMSLLDNKSAQRTLKKDVGFYNWETNASIRYKINKGAICTRIVIDACSGKVI